MGVRHGEAGAVVHQVGRVADRRGARPRPAGARAAPPRHVGGSVRPAGVPGRALRRGAHPSFRDHPFASPRSTGVRRRREGRHAARRGVAPYCGHGARRRPAVAGRRRGADRPLPRRPTWRDSRGRGDPERSPRRIARRRHPPRRVAVGPPHRIPGTIAAGNASLDMGLRTACAGRPPGSPAMSRLVARRFSAYRGRVLWLSQRVSRRIAGGFFACRDRQSG